MTCSENTNVDVGELAKLFFEADDFAICGHTSPDGDCIGSTLAVKSILDALGKRSWALVADSDFTSDSFDFMPGYDDLCFAGDFKEPAKVFISVDVPNDRRLGRFAAEVKERTSETITIDHHETDADASQYRYIDPDSASCTLIVWKIAQELLAICSDEVFDDEAMRKIAICC